ncbi:MAG: hypothetical protein A2Z16_11285 [Chloroflexi bacterium RBG_16_54_18]|nr:MAG: hypothetical protein A2Z16_11285 [Chloroflexi bacterium RBG_16_54_18]
MQISNRLEEIMILSLTTLEVLGSFPPIFFWTSGFQVSKSPGKPGHHLSAYKFKNYIVRNQLIICIRCSGWGINGRFAGFEDSNLHLRMILLHTFGKHQGRRGMEGGFEPGHPQLS